MFPYTLAVTRDNGSQVYNTFHRFYTFEQMEKYENYLKKQFGNAILDTRRYHLTPMD